MRLLLLGLWLAVAQDQRRLLAEVEAFDTQIEALDAQVASLEARAMEMHAAEATHRAKLAEADAALATRRAGTAGRVGAFYRLKRRGLARLLFDAETPAEFRRRVRYLLAILRADERRTREFVALVKERRAAAEKVAADTQVVEDLKADLAGKRTALETQRAERVALLRDVRRRPELATRALAERAEAAETLGASIRAVEATTPTVGAGDAAAFRGLKGRLPPPVDGRLARGFGPYLDATTGASATNHGLDFAAPLGAPFRAVAAGTVTRAGYQRGYGQMVVVQHGPYVTLYAHANGLRVAQGQAVQRGDVLGLVGNTGLLEDDEARLHFEIRYNNTPQDPTEWLAR